MRRQVVVVADERAVDAALAAAVSRIGKDGDIEVVRLLDGATLPGESDRARVVAHARAELDRLVDIAEHAFPQVRVASRVLLGDPSALLSELMGSASVLIA